MSESEIYYYIPWNSRSILKMGYLDLFFNFSTQKVDSCFLTMIFLCKINMCICYVGQIKMCSVSFLSVSL